MEVGRTWRGDSSPDQYRASNHYQYNPQNHFSAHQQTRAGGFARTTLVAGRLLDYLTQSSSVSFITSMVIHTLLLIILALIGAGSGLVDSLSLVNMGWTDASDTSTFDLEPYEYPRICRRLIKISRSKLAIRWRYPWIRSMPPTLDSSLETLPNSKRVLSSPTSLLQPVPPI